MKIDVCKHHVASLTKTSCPKTLQSVLEVSSISTHLDMSKVKLRHSHSPLLPIAPHNPLYFSNSLDCELNCQNRFMESYNKVHFIGVLNVSVSN